MAPAAVSGFIMVDAFDVLRGICNDRFEGMTGSVRREPDDSEWRFEGYTRSNNGWWCG